MYLYYYPEWEDRVEATYRYSEAMFDWFEQELGVPYPWGSYSQIPVQDFMYGAMENTTATLFGDFFFVDDRSYHDRNYVAVNAHELAHQWFGDYVTARSSAHHWLQESFATYYNTLYEKEAFGQDHYDWKRRQAVLQSLNASKKDHRPIANSRAGSTRHYPKGAHVLHMLRHLVGDELYRASIKHYLQKHPYGSVDSEDLLVAFYEVSGQPLNWFWEEWVYRGGEPEYQVSFEEVERSGRRFSEFTVEQVHQQTEVVGLFDMPMVFQVHYKDGTSSEEQHRIFEARQTVALANPENKEVAYVLFDPNSEVIKKVRFSKSTVMLMEQAEKATHMLDRYDALVALRSVPMAQKKPLYQRIWTNNDYHEVLGELIFQALIDDAPEWMIELAMAHENVQVQKHLARHLKTIDVNWIKTLEPLLTNPSYVTVEIALEKLCVASPTQAGQFLAACDGVMGTRGRNVRIKWLEMALNFQHDSKYEKELIEYTSVSYEFLTRTAAAQACVRLSLFNENVFQYLANGAGAYNRRLKGPCRQALREFYKEPIYRSMIRKYVAEGTWNADMQRFWDRLLG
ncbi:MAG: M1 family aminopeptidase [Salibacteraceae bacterium]